MKSFKFLITVFYFTIFSCQAQKSDKIVKLDAQTFSEKIQNHAGIQLLDVRTVEEYNSQHIMDAKNINWLGADFEQKTIVFNKSKPIFVYCKSGGRSSKAAAKLAELGFTKIYELDGGMISWNSTFLKK